MPIIKNFIVLCLLATLLLPSAAAQESDAASQTDSILALLPQLHGAEKLDALYEFINHSKFVMSSKPYIDMFLAEARRQNNIEMEGEALYILVDYYFVQFDNDSVYTVADDAIPFLRKHELYDLLNRVIHNVIVRHSFDGRFLTAMRMAEEYYEELKELQNDWLMASMLSSIASLYHDMGQAEEALRMLEMSLKLAKKNVEIDKMDDYLFYSIYHMMAVMTIEMKRYEDALLYIDSVQMVIENMQCNQSGIILYEERYSSYSTLVQIYAKMKRHEDARTALRQLEEIYKPEWEGAALEIELIEAYYNYYNETGNYEKALEYLNLIMHYFEETNVMPDILFAKVHLLFNMGDYRQATQIAIRVIEQRDTLDIQRFATQINELRTIYELDRAELEAERQRAKIRQQRIVNIALIGACVAALIIAALIAWNRKRIAQKNLALYRRIKEQDKVVEEQGWIINENKRISTELEELKKRYASEAAIEEKQAPSDEKTQYLILIAQMNEYLHEGRNFADPEKTNTENIIKTLATNRTYLYQAVKVVYGTGLQDHINTIRLEEARIMLEKTDDKIIAVSEACGYGHIKTFYRNFKERYGMAPAEYRKVNSR